MVLLIEPFLEDRDGIWWIKDLATEFPRTRILIVSRQSEQIYAQRGLHAGAGRADLDGSNPNQSFITGAFAPLGVAVDR